MKLKAAFRYQVVELVQSAVAFFLIIAAIIAIFLVGALANGAQMYLPNLSTLPYALMFLLSLATFSGDVRFFMRMGLTRPQIIASSAATLGTACLLLAAVEAVCSVVISFWPLAQSLFLMTYGTENGPALDFLFMLLGCAAASGAGLAFAALQTRFGMRRVVLGIAAVCIVAVVALQDASVSRACVETVPWLFGFGAGASLVNPFILFALVAALGVLVTWMVVRRFEVR